MTDSHGKIVIISGPSGAGKSTVVKALLQDCPVPLRPSVSATTRERREGEVDGRDYHFLSHAEFQRRREHGEFLECKEVFGRGDWYGTLRSEIEAGSGQDNDDQQPDGSPEWVLLEIDVAGALAVLAQIPDAVTIFLHPGSMEELERRLRARGTESPESLERRLEVARQELACIDHYQYEVINATVSRAAAEIGDILRQSGD